MQGTVWKNKMVKIKRLWVYELPTKEWKFRRYVAKRSAYCTAYNYGVYFFTYYVHGVADLQDVILLQADVAGDLSKKEVFETLINLCIARFGHPYA